MPTKNSTKFESINLVNLVDHQDNLIGTEDILKAHQNSPKLHRAVSVLLFNSKKELLLQQRSQTKPLWPLYWSNTICTHPAPNETSKHAAKRRLLEEFGIQTEVFYQYKFIYQARYSSDLSEYEFDSVFFSLSDQLPHPDINEIADYQYLPVDTIKKELTSKPQKYTPWFKLIMKKLHPSDILTS